jgi:glycosyltransferase involved in cell wall biosynthesis
VPLPQVTAVIPLHNHARWVQDAIGSIARQDYWRKRIVVVDDGSTDGGHNAVLVRLTDPEIVRADVTGFDHQAGTWMDTGVETHVVRYPEARGPAFARNRGMELLPSELDGLFAFLDSDDVYEPGKVAKSVAEFEKFPGLMGVVYSDYDTLRPDGLRLRQFKEPFSRERMLVECLPNCDSLVAARAIADVDGFDEELRVAEDLDLWLRISEKYLISHIPESLITIRVGQHSSTTTVKGDVWQSCYRRVMQKLADRQRGNG